MRTGLTIAMTLVAATAFGDDEQPPAPPPDTLVAQPSGGPAASVAEACKVMAPDESGSDEDDPPKCTRRKMKPKVKAAAPYDELALVERANSTYAQQSLAVRMGERWYLAPLVQWTTGGGDRGSLKIKSAKIKDVIPGGAPEILLVGVHTYDTEDDLNAYGSSYDALWVCSVGASGAPSCVEVPMGQSARPNPDNGIKPWKYRLTFKFDKDGKIVRTLKGKWPKHPEWFGGDELVEADFVNTRTLQFN